MPLSAARQSANAANAQLSTGPRTAYGKARAAQDARKHGLTAQDLVIGPEDREEFEALLADFQNDVAPQGALQQTLLDELVAAAWNLRRIRRLETELCSRAATYHDLLDDDDLQTKLDRLARHQSRIERSFPSLAPRAQVFANRRGSLAHASCRLHAASPAARLRNRNYKTNVRPNGADQQWVGVPLQGGVGTPG